MKALILSLVLALPVLASANTICGEVELGAGNFSCDVDYCPIHFVATNVETGASDRYGISDGGMPIHRDFQIEQYQLQDLTGKRLCVGPADISSFGSVDVNTLKAAAAVTVIN